MADLFKYQMDHVSNCALSHPEAMAHATMIFVSLLKTRNLRLDYPPLPIPPAPQLPPPSPLSVQSSQVPPSPVTDFLVSKPTLFFNDLCY